LLSRTLHDENNRFLPLFVSTLDGKDWKQPVTMYLTALSFKIFGPSFEALRGVSIVITLISLALLWIFIERNFNRITAVGGAFIYLTTPIVLIQSHLALENIAPVPFVLLWLLMLGEYQRSRKHKFALFAGVALGLSLYAYQAMRLIAPIFALLSVAYFIYLGFIKKKENYWMSVFFFTLGLLPFVLGMLGIRIFYPGAITAYNQPFKLISYQELLLSYLSSFDLSFLFVKGDSTLYHSTGKHGMYLLAALPLFLIGCYQTFRKKSPLLILVLGAFMFTPLLFGLVASVHRASRLIAMLPSFVIISSVGLEAIDQLKNKIWRRTGLIIIALLVIVTFYDFAKDYWFNYPDRARLVFVSTSHLIFKDLYTQSQQLSKIPVIKRDIFRRERMASDFFEQVYFPNSLKQWEIGEAIDKNSIILSYTSDSVILEKHGFKKVGLSTPDYSLFASQ